MTSEEAIQAEQQLIDAISKPENLQRVSRIINALPAVEKLMNKLSEMDSKGQLDSLLSGLDELVSLIDIIQKGDIISALINFGMDQVKTLQAVWPLIEKLQKMQDSGALDKLYNVLDVLSDPQVLDKLSTIVTAVANATRSEPKPIGYTGLLTALRDKDVALALGVLISIAKEIGKGIRQATT